MVVKLRLARFGRRNLPFFRIYVADSRAPRDGRHVEIIGYYNPLPGADGMKRIGIKTDRAKYWLAVGAQPSHPVSFLLWKVGILPKPPTAELMSKDDAAKVLAQIKASEKQKQLNEPQQSSKNSSSKP